MLTLHQGSRSEQIKQINKDQQRELSVNILFYSPPSAFWNTIIIGLSTSREDEVILAQSSM
jgi:hypothetical protein